MAILIINGVKFYPVCSVEKEHIFYTAVNRAENMLYDYFETGKGNFEKLDNAVEYARKALDIFNKAPRRGGLIYANWRDGQLLREVIIAYKIRLDENMRK